MIKIFYSVDYMILGSDKKHRMWFDNLEEAIKFSKAECRDNPVRRIYFTEELIKMVEQLVELQKKLSLTNSAKRAIIKVITNTVIINKNKKQRSKKK